jgi:hypothetical protein
MRTITSSTTSILLFAVLRSSSVIVNAQNYAVPVVTIITADEDGPSAGNTTNTTTTTITNPGGTTSNTSNTDTTTTTTTIPIEFDGEPECESNPYCASLEGLCCPDSNGTMLDCCYWNDTVTAIMTNETMAPSPFTTTTDGGSMAPTTTTGASSSFSPTSAPSSFGTTSFTSTSSSTIMPTSIPVFVNVTSEFCLDNAACAVLDLVGECCPDANGTMLDCCYGAGADDDVDAGDEDVLDVDGDEDVDDEDVDEDVDDGDVGGDVDQEGASDMPSDMPSLGNLMPSPGIGSTTVAPSASPGTMEPSAAATNDTSSRTSGEPTASPSDTTDASVPGIPVSEEIDGIKMILSGVGDLDDAAITSWTAMTTDFYESVHGPGSDVAEGVQNFTTVITFQNQSVAADGSSNTLTYAQQVDYIASEDDDTAPSALELIEGPFQDASLVQIYTDTLRKSDEAFTALPTSGSAVQLVSPNSNTTPKPPATEVPTSGVLAVSSSSSVVVMMMSVVATVVSLSL